MIHGDRMVLVALDPVEIGRWASSRGNDATDPGSLCACPRVIRLVESVVIEKNEEPADDEQAKGFRIVPEGFSEEAGTLTATLKVTRHVQFHIPGAPGLEDLVSVREVRFGIIGHATE
jgi:long-subunit acyl-CoA synthetase (AMP-forming)